MASPEDVRTRWHARLGAVAVVTALLDLVGFRVAAGGRDGYAALLGSAGQGHFADVVGTVVAALGLAAVVGVVVHGLLGLSALRRDAGPGLYPDRDRRRLQGILGVALVPFVGLRLAYGPLGGVVLGLDAFGLHQAMLDDFGTLPFILVQTIGAPALALHLLEGLSARARARGARRAVPFVVALSAAYVVVYFDALAAFVVGRTFLPHG